MEISHTIDFEPEDDIEPILNALNIGYEKLPFVNRFIIRVRITESAPHWQEFQALYQAKGKWGGAYDTYFTRQEILSAEWLRIWGGYPQIGYPQPERRWQEEDFNYEGTCPKCGSFRQVSSFFIKSEPKLRRYDFMSLYWTSALFAVPRVFTALEANNITGYERWPVFIHKTKEPSVTVSQLYIYAATVPSVVHAEELEPFICDNCGQLKYKSYHKRGIMYLKRDAIPAGVDIFETYEWFGDGHQPRREIIVSNRVAQLAYAEKWKGVTFKVAEAV